MLLNKYTNEVLESYYEMIKEVLKVKKDHKYVSVIAPVTGYRYEVKKKN